MSNDIARPPAVPRVEIVVRYGRTCRRCGATMVSLPRQANPVPSPGCPRLLGQIRYACPRCGGRTS